MSTLQRMIVAFAIVVAIGAAQGLLMLSNLGSLGDKITYVATRPIAEVDNARAAWSAYRDAQGYLASFLEMTRPQDSKVALGEFNARVKVLTDHLDRLAGSSAAAADKLKAAKGDVGAWAEKARVLLGATGATSIPAPHALAQIEVAVRKNLDQLVSLALADANAIRADVEESIARVRQLGMIFIAFGIVAGAAIAVFMGRAITRPLHRLAATMRQLSQGQLDVAVADQKRKDEIGGMASAVQVFKDNMMETARLRAEQAELESRAVAQRRADMDRLASEFEAAVSNIVDTVSSASGQLEVAAGTLTTTAETTQQLSSNVASASEQASANVQSVAAATEQMTGSVSEIARQVQESSRIAGEAVKQAERTDARIAELSQAASRIGDVVKLITAVAEQTNLLALNATIEAARAGEAGKGFAVVAQEVKALAGQTAKATDEISSQIAGMQSATKDSVAAIKEIGTTIGRISEIASAIASAVEEQGATTQEISRSVQQAAQGTSHVATNITDVNRGARDTGTASAQVLGSAQSLARESSHLKVEVQKFLSTVRAA
jgi:methyl-accepting chemotaxis protein